MDSIWALFGRFDVWLIAVGGVLLLRQLFTALAADHGRRQDLVRRLYKPSQDFQISILIPCLKTSQLTELLELLATIHEQEYPSAKVAVHIVTSEATHHDLEGFQMQEVLAPNVRLWRYPNAIPVYEKALGWLIDRCLAVGGAGMFVFLKPSDMIKPDFLQNIVARGFDSFVIQGYVANKNFPTTAVEKVSALTRRLVNRIGNAGRYHLGLSCRLQDSGWAIKQDVLELVPFHRGHDIDNLEYTLRLNLENFRVSWAPGVVVYSRDEQDFSEWVTLSVGVTINRFRMFLAYAPRLLTRAITRFDLTYLESALSIIKPPTVFIGATLTMMGILASVVPQDYWAFGNSIAWFALALCLVVVQFCNVAVARSKVHEYVTLAILTPLVYTAGLVMFPVGAVQYWSYLVAQRQLEEEVRHRTYKKRRSTRFDETQDPVRHQVDITQEAGFMGGQNDPFTPSRRLIQELLHEQADEAISSGEVPAHLSSSASALDSLFAMKKRSESTVRSSSSSKQDFWSGVKQNVKQNLPFQKKEYASQIALNERPLIQFENESFETERSLHQSQYNMIDDQSQKLETLQNTWQNHFESEPVDPAKFQDSVLLPMEQIKTITVSNGQKQIDCLLKTLTTYDVVGDEYYKLTLEYKSLSFSTSTYKILDQAFYELYAKLSGKGLTVVSCGSCGYFYNPTADVPGTLRNSGVCLFGKNGKDVNLNTDAVTVLSPPCDYHRRIEDRELLVQQWKDSLGSKQRQAANW